MNKHINEMQKDQKKVHVITVSDLDFTVERVIGVRQIQYWEVTAPNGMTQSAGAMGFGDSKPKIKEGLEYLVERFGKARFYEWYSA